MAGGLKQSASGSSGSSGMAGPGVSLAVGLRPLRGLRHFLGEFAVAVPVLGRRLGRAAALDRPLLVRAALHALGAGVGERPAGAFTPLSVGRAGGRLGGLLPEPFGVRLPERLQLGLGHVQLLEELLVHLLEVLQLQLAGAGAVGGARLGAGAVLGLALVAAVARGPLV